MNGSRSALAVDFLIRYANCQVVATVVVKVTGGQAKTKLVAVLRLLHQAAAILSPVLVSVRSQSGTGPIKYIHYAGITNGTVVLKRHSNRQIITSVVVKITHCQTEAQPIVGFRDTENAAGFLVPDLVAAASQPIS